MRVDGTRKLSATFIPFYMQPYQHTRINLRSSVASCHEKSKANVLLIICVQTNNFKRCNKHAQHLVYMMSNFHDVQIRYICCSVSWLLDLQDINDADLLCRTDALRRTRLVVGIRSHNTVLINLSYTFIISHRIIIMCTVEMQVHCIDPICNSSLSSSTFSFNRRNLRCRFFISPNITFNIQKLMFYM